MIKETFKTFSTNSVIQFVGLICATLLIIISISVFSPMRTEAAPFTCDDSFYQVINGTLTQLDPNTGQYITLGGTGSLNTNAVGYNREDNYLYAIQRISLGGSEGLVRLEHDGTPTPLGIPTNLPWPGSYVSGDFDDAGNLLVSSGSTTLYSIDVSTNIATPIALTAIVPANDLVFVSGMLYGVSSSGVLIEVNPATGVVTSKPTGIAADSVSPVSVYGAGWAADDSKLFFSRNSDGMIFEISNFTGPNPTGAIVLDGDSATGNDGAACSIARSPIPAFFATNDFDSTTMNNPITIPANQGLLVNDSGRQISVTSYTQPVNGVVSVNPDGSYTYTPNTGFTGTDIFTYVITDEYGETEMATVTITVSASLTAPGITGPQSLASTGTPQFAVITLALIATVFSGIYIQQRLTR